ncbi:MAG: carboxylating nicotinate-nucleotide diphosphorylase [Candidatus Muiribacteriota bacterium]
MNLFEVDALIKKAFDEDLGLAGDITTENIFNSDEKSYGKFVAKSDGVCCGLNIVKRVYELYDTDVNFITNIKDGDYYTKGTIIAEVRGKTISLLICERIALNFLQHLSGISTSTQKLVISLGRKDVKICDTRKTIPGLRQLQKYAVKTGGGYNHRLGLFDAVMLKENHIHAAGGIVNAVNIIRKKIGHTVKIEVETTNLVEVGHALEAQVDIIMLDNMDYVIMEKACKLIDGKALIEVSGNITPENIKERIGTLPINIVSSGYITHSVKAADISFLFS